MTHIVTEACINCKYTDCVAVCPVDCFQQGKNMLVIDPEVCIDCGLCPSECPVEAIYPEDELPEDQEEFLEINAKYAHWPVIDEQQSPMDGADEAAKVTDKKHLIDPNPSGGESDDS